MSNLDIFYSEEWEDCNFTFELQENRLFHSDAIMTTITIIFPYDKYTQFIPRTTKPWLDWYVKTMLRDNEIEYSREFILKKLIQFVDEYRKR